VILYHFTCADAHKRIGRCNCLIIPQRVRHPVADWPPLSWFTTEAEPAREAIGLGAVRTACDRMTHRYVITDSSRCVPWLTCPLRPATPESFLRDLEEISKPETWWITEKPVRAEWDRAWRQGARVS